MRISDWSSDVCSSDLGVTPTTAGRLAANCRLDPGIRALFARQASEGLDQEYEQTGSNIFSPNGGNLDLKEETADTLTLGAVFAPRFARGLSLAVDYYSIKIRDAIDAYTNHATQLQCYAHDVPPTDTPLSPAHHP